MVRTAVGVDGGEGAGGGEKGACTLCIVRSFSEYNLKQKLLAFLNSGWQILDLQISLCAFLYFETFFHQKILKPHMKMVVSLNSSLY